MRYKKRSNIVEVKLFLRKWKKPVLLRFSAVPVIFKEFRMQKMIVKQIKRCKALGITIQNFSLWRNVQVSWKMLDKYEKMTISGTFPVLKTRIFFLENGFKLHFGSTNTHLYAKNQKKQMMKSQKNAKKPFFRYISGIFGRKNIFF